MRIPFKALMASAFLLSGAAIFDPGPASAQQVGPPRIPPSPSLGGGPGGGGRFLPPSVGRPAAPSFRGGSYGPRYAGPRPYGGAYAGRPYYRSGYYGGRSYRPAYYGRRYYGGYPYGYYNRGYYNGGAVVAGLIGGLTLGALANPYYGPGYYAPAYYPPRCVLERRRVVNRYGRRVWQRVQVCY